MVGTCGKEVQQIPKISSKYNPTGRKKSGTPQKTWKDHMLILSESNNSIPQ